MIRLENSNNELVIKFQFFSFWVKMNLMKAQKTRKYDIVVGIPSFNNEKTIEHVLKAVSFGLVKYFPNFSSLVVNSDGGSKDKTTQIFKNYCLNGCDLNSVIFHQYHPANKKLKKPAKISLRYEGTPGKGSALKAVFKLAVKHGAKVCVVVDSDLRSITPEWIQLLAAPIIYQDFDYVTPLYSRHKYDGTITNSIIYPLTRALYGKNIRQPIGGEFGISNTLLKNFLKQGVQNTEIAKFGIDIWMTTTAVAEGYNIAQVFLGAKLHDAKNPSESLGPMFSQAITTLFKLMDKYQEVWKKTKKEKTTALFGFETEVEPAPIQINEKHLIKKFKEGFRNFKKIYKKILSPETYKNIKRGRLLKFNPKLWTECIYEIALAFHKNRYDEETQRKLIEILVPLYFGFVAGFSEATKGISSYESEIFIEKIYEEFEGKKPFLSKLWK